MNKKRGCNARICVAPPQHIYTPSVRDAMPERKKRHSLGTGSGFQGCVSYKTIDRTRVVRLLLPIPFDTTALYQVPWRPTWKTTAASQTRLDRI